jgi:hypothetical protein
MKASAVPVDHDEFVEAPAAGHVADVTSPHGVVMGAGARDPRSAGSGAKDDSANAPTASRSDNTTNAAGAVTQRRRRAGSAMAGGW